MSESNGSQAAPVATATPEPAEQIHHDPPIETLPQVVQDAIAILEDASNKLSAAGDIRTASIPKELAVKIATAREKCSRVKKNGYNEHFKYHYVRAEDVIDEANTALDEAGLILWSKATSIQYTAGPKQRLIEVMFEFHVYDAESGQGIVLEDFPAAAADNNPGDKAFWKALTGARKYFLSDFLGIPFGDDPEDEGTSTGGNSGKSAAAVPGQASEAQSKYAHDKLDSLSVPVEVKEAVWNWAMIANTEVVDGQKASQIIDMVDEGRGTELVALSGWSGEVARPNPTAPDAAAPEAISAPQPPVTTEPQAAAQPPAAAPLVGGMPTGETENLNGGIHPTEIRQRVADAQQQGGYGDNTVGKLAQLIYGSRIVDRLKQEQVVDLAETLGYTTALGWDDAFLDQQATRALEQEDREAAATHFVTCVASAVAKQTAEPAAAGQ